MPVQVRDAVELPIRYEANIAEVRRSARALAQSCGFDSFATAALTTAASELARNVWVHGGGGSATVEDLSDGQRSGVRMTFRDSGPGMSEADLQRALAGGFSTARSLGLGLSGTRRLVDEFSVDTRPGGGTVVVITKWTRF